MFPPRFSLQRRRLLVAIVLVSVLGGGVVASVAVPLDVENTPPDDAVYGYEAVEFEYDRSYTFHGTATGQQTAGFVVWLPDTDGWGRVERVDNERVHLEETGWYDADSNRSYWRRRATGTAGESVVEKYTENGVVYHRIQGLPPERVTEYTETKMSSDERVVSTNKSAGVVILAYGEPGDDPRDGFKPTLSRFTSAHVVPTGENRYAFVAAGIERNASGQIRVTNNGLRVNSTVSQLYPQGVTHDYKVNAVTLLFGARQTWNVSYVVKSQNTSNKSRPAWVERATTSE